MKAPFSAYLDSITPYLREVVRILSEKYDYVSVLSTDSTGFSLAISQHSKSVSNANMTTERGNVVRVAKNGRYSEYAWNLFDAEKPEETAKKIEEAFDIGFYDYVDSGCLCVIEWPENIEDILPEETLKVTIRVNPDESRTLSWED